VLTHAECNTELFHVRAEEIYRQARERISGSALEILTPGDSEFLIGDVPHPDHPTRLPPARRRSRHRPRRRPHRHHAARPPPPRAGPPSWPRTRSPPPTPIRSRAPANTSTSAPAADSNSSSAHSRT